MPSLQRSPSSTTPRSAPRTGISAASPGCISTFLSLPARARSGRLPPPTARAGLDLVVGVAGEAENAAHPVGLDVEAVVSTRWRGDDPETDELVPAVGLGAPAVGAADVAGTDQVGAAAQDAEDLGRGARRLPAVAGIVRVEEGRGGRVRPPEAERPLPHVAAHLLATEGARAAGEAAHRADLAKAGPCAVGAVGVGRVSPGVGTGVDVAARRPLPLGLGRQPDLPALRQAAALAPTAGEPLTEDPRVVPAHPHHRPVARAAETSGVRGTVAGARQELAELGHRHREAGDPVGV